MLFRIKPTLDPQGTVELVLEYIASQIRFNFNPREVLWAVRSP